MTEPRFGNRAARVELRPGTAEEKVVVRFEVTRSERLNRLTGEGSTAPDAAGGKPKARAARAIYGPVVTSLRYDRSGTGWGSGDIFWAGDARRGNCTDFHPVFIGYSRALGIPARFELGFPVPPRRGAGEVAGYHCRAQFHLAGRGWVPGDASAAAKHPEKREYFFGGLDADRVLFTVGRDLVLPGMEDQPLNFFIYPWAEVEGKKHAAVEKRFAYRDL